MCGASIPTISFTTNKRHPLHDIVNALLVYASCRRLADDYRGATFSISSAYVAEAAGFVLGFHYGGTGDHLSGNDFVTPKRYFDLVQTVNQVQSMPPDPKNDPEYARWLQLNKKFGKGPTE
jgi:hypothetical protein